MATLIAIPILGILTIIQAGIASRINLLQGTADLVLITIIAWALQKQVTTAWQWCIIGGLMIGITTALPPGFHLLSYGLITGIALFIRKRVWQIPILAMFVVTFLGTLVTHTLAIISLRMVGNPILIVDSLNLITLPSLLLNLLLAVPAYILMGDLAKWLYPEEIEV